MNVQHTILETTLGPITIVADDDSVTGLYFEKHVRRPARKTFGTLVPRSENRVLTDAGRQLSEYLDGERQTFDLPLAPGATPSADFQRSVWRLVNAIPFGRTTTYGQIAEQLGDRSLAQKVGQAVGANPLCIFVPCHRVLGATGALTGYAGGLARKQALLELEEPAAVSAGRLF